MKKVLISIVSVIAIIAVLIVGKIQMDKYRVKSIVHSEEGKAAIENMLKIMDEKALTPEGKIKSYKIDDSYTYKNPMGGVGIKLIINNDNDLTVKTVLNKYPSIIPLVEEIKNDSKAGALQKRAISLLKE